jgi:hypothetical protein
MQSIRDVAHVCRELLQIGSLRGDDAWIARRNQGEGLRAVVA